MMIYVITAIFTCLLTMLDRIVNKKNKRMGILIWIAIIFISIVAGCRDLGVGTDTKVYGESFYNVMCGLEWYRAVKMNLNMHLEYGFFVMTFLLSRLTKDAFWYYFLIQFICSFFVFKAVKNMEIGRYSWIAVFLFNTLFFSYNLNLMRQSIAISIMLYAFRYVREHNLKKYIMWVVISMAFHYTAFVSIIIYPLYFICCSSKKYDYRKSIFEFLKKYRFLIIIVAMFLSIIIVVFGKQLIQLYSLFKPTYEYQANQAHDFNPTIGYFLVMLVFTIPFIIFSVWTKKNNGELLFFLSILLLSTILWQIQGVSSEAYRIVLYFWMLIILGVPLFIKHLQNKINRSFTIYYYLACGILYYWFSFIYSGANQVYPYASKLLGI